jgi:hypothetical protein
VQSLAEELDVIDREPEDLALPQPGPATTAFPPAASPPEYGPAPTGGFFGSEPEAATIG